MNSFRTAFVSAFISLSSILLPAATSPAANRPASSSGSGAAAVRIENEARRTLYLASFEQHVMRSYAQSKLVTADLAPDVYREALVGFYNLQQRGVISPSQHVLTIIDFNRSSRLKRLWVIDLREQRLLFHSLVAHGKNTGEEFATAFSNREGSEMSSLGFYVTGHTYTGKHGLSLKLKGVDPGYNTNAATRAVVVHGADYVSEDFVREHGRLGRSQGCPALPSNESSDIIRAIYGGSVVYAHAPRGVAYQSNWLQLDPALLAFARSQGIDSHG
ncbi:murein L,D-transpeptidase catalytic domain family protein [Hymenobacter sp. BT491]|uniref:murein L,D-transpeptidase catalytic domain family protein n=1 Tax=Hymenobacter sp. BT491 TaxID=2766779 RepID=UPI001CA3B704|nr:murein L,D-transpeptidase catalytic domain family protein [Hymenobacter sp. BT491]